MEAEKASETKSSIFKKLESYLSLNKRAKSPTKMMSKSKSWHATKSNSSKNVTKPIETCQVAPNGCFSVYVGPEKQRFVIKTKYSNHPLFKMLLEDAELEYGFHCEGPLLLPCEVDLFCKILAEIMASGKEEGDFAHGSCSPFTPTKRLGKSSMAKGYGSYGLLTPPRLLKINHF